MHFENLSFKLRMTALTNCLRFIMNKFIGEVLIFDNWRLLHGREGFDPSKGHRHLEGCYIDWDEVYSRIRVLRN